MFGHIKARFEYMVPRDLQWELALEKHKLRKKQLCKPLKFREAYLHIVQVSPNSQMSHTSDILSGTLLWEAVLCIIASTHYIPIAFPLSCVNQKCLQLMPNVPWGTKVTPG